MPEWVLISSGVFMWVSLVTCFAVWIYVFISLGRLTENMDKTMCIVFKTMENENRFLEEQIKKLDFL